MVADWKQLLGFVRIRLGNGENRGETSLVVNSAVFLLAPGARGTSPVSLVWLLLLPFRIVGIAVEGVLELVWAMVTLPARLIRAL